MGSLRLGAGVWIAAAVLPFLFLAACGGHSKPAGTSPFPLKISLSPATSFSAQAGTTFLFTASARNNTNTALSLAFTYTSSNPDILTVAPNGLACAGNWNAPIYSICTPAGIGVAQVTASALGASSPPTLIFVHPPIDNIQIRVVPPVNSPPPACPSQQALPAACAFLANRNVGNSCLSDNQVQTVEAIAYSQGTDITASVGPFTWTDASTSVAKITPIITSSDNVATNQATISPNTPGQTQVIASASGFSSQPYVFETCPVQCITLELGVNGSQRSGETSFVVNKGTSETITATAVDVQGCIVPKPPLTWTSSAPAALSVGTGCAAGTTCTVTTNKPGSAAITASCTPPTCNIGFPLNPAGLADPFIPKPVYPVSAISGLATGAPVATSVIASSQNCSTDQLCAVAVYDVSTTNNLPGSPSQIPPAPNSVMFDLAGDRAYLGSQFGALAVTAGSNLGFASLSAPGTPLGLVTGKIIAISHNGSQAIFSDTVSTPNQVYVTSSTASTAALNINNATAAAFSPDGLKAFILGDGGSTLYTYSTLQALQPGVALPTPANSIAFSSTGSFALFSGGAAAGSLAGRNTCDNSPLTFPAGTILTPPIFLKLVPAGNIPVGFPAIPSALQSSGLDYFFGLDNTGIDVIATNSSQPPIGILCPQTVALAQTATAPPKPFALHLDIGQGTFNPVAFFLSPDSTQAYIVATDRSSILVYNFSTNSVRGIPLLNNATPVSGPGLENVADITSDGTLIYVAGSDGLLHAVNTALGADETQISFPALPNLGTSFCYTGATCSLDLVAVKP